MRELIIASNDAGQRLDKFLTKAVPRLPQGLLYKYLRTKRIKLNGGRAEISFRLRQGDRVQLYIHDEFFQENPSMDFLRASSGLKLLYEDENLLLADKEPGLCVHEDNDHTADTLINRILRYLHEKGEYDPGRSFPSRLRWPTALIGIPAVLYWPPKTRKPCGF